MLDVSSCKRVVALVATIALVLSAFSFATFAPVQAHAATANCTTPTIQGTNISQAYNVQNYAKTRVFAKPTSNGWKWYDFNFGNRNYVNWYDSNEVTVRFQNNCSGDGLSANYYIEKSINPNSEFYREYVYPQSLGNGSYSATFNAERGETLYCRLGVEYSYYDNSKQNFVTEEKTSGVFSFRTSPKTFIAKKLLIKKGKSWKSKLGTKAKSWKKKKGKKRYIYGHTYKITWNKRSDVDGYNVYKVGYKQKQIAKFSSIKQIKLKSWQYYLDSDLVSYNGMYAGISAKSYCKKVKSLKANATSYTFKQQNFSKGIVFDKYNACDSHTEYIIVPYINQNGKTYLGDATSYCLDYGYYYPNSDLDSEKYGFFTFTNTHTKELPFFGTSTNSSEFKKPIS